MRDLILGLVLFLWASCVAGQNFQQVPQGSRSVSGNLAAGQALFYQFSGLPAQSCFSIPEDGDFDILTGWFDESNQIIDTADYTLTGQVPQNGILKIGITGWNDNQFVGDHSRSGTFTITIDATAIPQDGNNNFPTSSIVPAGEVSFVSDLYAVEGSCGAPHDVDFITFTLPPGSCWTTSITRDFDEWLGLFSNNGTKLDEDDYSLNGIVDSSGKVNIAITGYRDSNFNGTHTKDGEYNLTLTVATIPENVDNTFETRAQLPAGQTTVTGNIWRITGNCAAGDVDFMTFSLSPGVCAQTAITRDFDEIFGLFADNGTQLSYNDYQITTIVPASGKLNLAISGYNDNTFVGSHSKEGDYTLTINTFATAQDGNNNFASASVVNGAATRSFLSQLETVSTPCAASGDVDFVRFTNLPVGHCFYTLMARDFDEILGLYDSNGVLIDTDDYTISGQVPADGQVIIAVSGWNDNEFVGSHTKSGAYNLTVQTISPATSDGNNNIQTRTMVPAGQLSVTSDLYATAAPPCDTVSDVDYFEFQVGGGSCFSAQVTNSNFDDMIGWYDVNGTRITYLDSGSISGVAPANGRIILAVTGYPDTRFTGSHSRSGDYTLTVTAIQGQTDDSESFAQTKFQFGNVVTGDLYQATPGCGGGDIDYWLLFSSAGGCFYTNKTTSFDDYLGAFNMGGQLITKGDGEIAGIVPPDGAVVLAVTGYPDTNFEKDHTKSGTYSIQLNVETVVADNDNTFVQRRSTPVQNLPLNGSLSGFTQCQGAAGDVDFFTVTGLTPGACFQTQITRDFDELWGLFDDSGALIDTDDNGFTARVPQSGRVNLALTGYNDDQFTGNHNKKGTYSVSLQISVNTPPQEDGNDSFQTATVVAPGTLTFEGTLFSVADTTPCPDDNRPSDVDYVKFTVEPNCYVTADLVSSGFDDFLGYFNTSGHLVSTVDTGAFEIQAGPTGDIVFGITAYPDTTFTGAHSGNGNYTLNLVLDCGNAPEPFQRVRGGARQVSGTIAPGQVGFWTFEDLPPGACFTTNMVRDFDELLGWFDDTPSEIDEDDNQIQGIVPLSGQVNIAVTGWYDGNFVGAHDKTGTYTLSLTITQNDPPPPSDGNDNFLQRVNVSTTSVSGSIWATIDRTPCPNDHNTVNDVDYYTFNGLTPTYCVSTRMDENFDSGIGLLSDNGTIQAWEDNTLHTLVPASGHLNLAVTGYPDRQLVGAHQKNGNYTLYLDVTHNDPAPPSDGNNQFNTPTILPFDVFEVDGSIWSLTDKTPCPGDFNPLGDVDYYRFGPLVEGHCFQTHMERNFDEILGWFSSTGSRLASDDNQITNTVPAGGLLYIAVSGWPDFDFVGDHTYNGNYTLSVTTSFNEPPPASDGNDNFASATLVESGTTLVSDSIWATIDQTPCPDDHNRVNDVDFWTFQGLQEGSCFETIVDSDFNEHLGYFDANGQLVEESSYRIVGLIPDNGQVTVAVSGWYDPSFNGSHQQNGEYSLRLSVTRNDDPGEMVDNSFVNRNILPAGQRTYSTSLWAVRDRTPCPNDVPQSDVDFFTFTGLPAGTCFRTETNRDFDEIIGWYGEDGLQMTWSDYNIWGVVPENGMVNLAMSGWADWNFDGSHSLTGTYVLSIVLDPECGGFGGGSSGLGEWCGNNCGDKPCGSDGCGGSCGSCNAGEFCVGGGMECSATCTSICTADQECGADGCGGSCGDCEGDQDVCSGGQCVCVPECSDVECGDDGCGGSCGSCDGQDECFDGFCVCVPDCTNVECGWDGCGGICGVCGPYYTCGDEGMCVRDPMTQPSCDDYMGLPHQEVSLTLLREVNGLLRAEIRSTIDNLEEMREALLDYDPETQQLDLAALIDQLHLFCSGPYQEDNCLSLSEIGFIESAFLHAINVITTSPAEECAGRVCGTTEYGGNCGTCPTGQECTEDGQCVCSYDCTGRECGDSVQPEGTSLTLCPAQSCGSCPNRWECDSEEYMCVKLPHQPILLHPVDCETLESLNVDVAIDITSEQLGYSDTAIYTVGNIPTWVPPDHEGYFNFTLTGTGYEQTIDERSFVWETEYMQFCLQRSTFPLSIRDASTQDLVQSDCSAAWMIGSSSSQFTTPPNPATITVPDNGFGTYQFDVTCFGYDAKSEMVEVAEPAGEVTIELQRSPVMLGIVNCQSTEPLTVNSSITVMEAATGYTETLALDPSSTVAWVPPFSGSFDFMTSASGYQTSGENRQVDLGLAELTFCLDRSTFQVEIRDMADQSLVNDGCFVEWVTPQGEAGETFVIQNPFTVEVPDDGYGDWFFTVNCTSYGESSSDVPVSADTTVATLYISRAVMITLKDCESTVALSVNSTLMLSSASGYESTVSLVGGVSTYSWVPPASGEYTLHATAEGYTDAMETTEVTDGPQSLELCLNRQQVRVSVVDEMGEPANGTCTVEIQRVGAEFPETTAPNPFVWTLPDYPYTEWTFQTRCDEYNEQIDTVSVTAETTEVLIEVTPLE